MLYKRRKLLAMAFLLLTRRYLSITTTKTGSCNTVTIYTKNYTEANPDLLIVSFLTMIKDDDNFLELADLRSEPSGDFNINHLIYIYPYNSCHLNIMTAFIDVLLNETLLNGRPFKIIAILTLIDETELINLANIMSPYFTMIAPVIPLKYSKIRHLQSLYKYYDNVLSSGVGKNWDRIEFLYKFVRTFNVKLVSIFYDSKEVDIMEEINTISSSSHHSDFCVNIYYVSFTRSKKQVTLSVEASYSNVFVLIFKDYELSLKMIDIISKSNNKNKTIIIYNDNWSTTRRLEEELLNSKTSNLQIYVYKISNNVSVIRSEFEALVDVVPNTISRYSKYVIEILKNDAPIRTFSLASRDPLFWLRWSIWFFLTVNSFVNFQDLEVYIYETRNSRQSSNLVYSKFGWRCGECTHLILQPVCNKSNCSDGYFPVYFSQTCCWRCQPCYPGFVKSEEGQHVCSKCPADSIPNKNQTKCLNVEYTYFIISDFQQLVAVTLTSIGSVYTLCFLTVFLFYKNTPIVKTSNFRLSVCQILLHLIINIHMAMTILEQKKWICFTHSIAGGYFLRFIMSIYIVKTNQLLTIFQSNVKIRRTVGLTLKEVAFSVAYNAASIFVDVIYLALYHKYEYGIHQTNGSLFIYNYCKMTSYFYIGTIFLIVLSIICSVQAFLARKLPANFNETYYIFLGMFTTTILLVLSIPLNGSFDHDGQKIFVNSIVIYFANMALISIAYGYKIHIMLFQKHRNTKEAFQRSMREAMQKYLKEAA